MVRISPVARKGQRHITARQQLLERCRRHIAQLQPNPLCEDARSGAWKARLRAQLAQLARIPEDDPWWASRAADGGAGAAWMLAFGVADYRRNRRTNDRQ